ncbi:MAG: tyrosine-type recombinase/integrase [Candidatus Dormibacteria bacterium]
MVAAPAPQRDDQPLSSLSAEWLSDLKYLGRSDETIRWYQRKIGAFLLDTGMVALDQVVAREVKAYLGGLRERGLADDTIHGFFATIKAFANWADREGYAVEKAMLTMRGPQAAQKEREVYSAAQLAAIFRVLPPGWALLAAQTLLGTGMRISELCNLRLDDFEDDAGAAFLKIQKGKGSKFRRAPVSERLRRELRRYLNRARPESASDNLFLLADGRPLTVGAVGKMLGRARAALGFSIHAHKFRHTFATMYVENGGDIERLRKILGHSTYAMILRYVHLNKRDLAQDFDDRTPF